MLDDSYHVPLRDSLADEPGGYAPGQAGEAVVTPESPLVSPIAGESDTICRRRLVKPAKQRSTQFQPLALDYSCCRAMPVQTLTSCCQLKGCMLECSLIVHDKEGVRAKSVAICAPDQKLTDRGRSYLMGERTQLNHHPRCYGCGVANETGLKLVAEWDGDQCFITHSPPVDAEGGPGIVHGGYVGALADEAMALVASHVSGSPAMTRRIELDFRSPTLTQAALTMRAWVEQERTGSVIVRLTGEQGEPAKLCFEAKGVFIKVPGSAWADPMNAAGRTSDKLEFGTGDPSNFFRWQLRGFKSMYDPAKLDREVRVAVVISGVTPPAWTIMASRAGFDAAEGTAEPVDATLSCDFATWERLAHDPDVRLATLAEVGQASFTGDASAIGVLLTLFHRHNSPG